MAMIRGVFVFVPVLLAATLSGCAVIAVADAAVSVGAAAVSVAATTVSVGAKVVGAAVDVVIPDDDDKEQVEADSQEGR
jgi:hypothetical protein